MFASALGAIAGGDMNRLKLPRVPSTVVVLIDGLGYENLNENLGHARNLARLAQNSSSGAIRCGFPSTTAVSLTSFGTGLRAGTHGILGYQVKSANDQIRNMLTGWQVGDDPRLWQMNRTICETATELGVTPYMVASPEYEGSGFSNVIMSGATFVGVGDLERRAGETDRLARIKGSLVYLYFAELDQAAHRFGSGSKEWLDALEAIDAAVGRLAGAYGLLVTADHGIVDVPQENHFYLDEVPGFCEAVSLAVGDPRALFCYGDRSSATDALEKYGFSGYVVDFAELESKGWVAGAVTIDQVPDFVIISRGVTASYDRRTAKAQSLKMIGQHGGVDDRETRVPLLRGGLFV